LLEIATRHTSGAEAIGAAFMLVSTGMAAGGVRATPTSTTIRGPKKGAKGRKKGQKCRPHHLTTMANNGNVGEEVEDSNKEFKVSPEHDFKRCTRPPKDHFEKILEVACPSHPYPIKNKLRDYAMMKKFMMSGAPPGGDEPARDSKGKDVALLPRKVEVVTITG
jgi:hypothetical protein